MPRQHKLNKVNIYSKAVDLLLVESS